MLLDLDDGRRAFRDAVRSWVDEHCPPDRALELEKREYQYPYELWDAMADAGFHVLAPGERLISSMSPTVVSSEEGGIVALGSPGASRIPTAILQALVGVLDHGLSLTEAVRAPRFHAEDLPEGSLLAYEAGSRAAGAIETVAAGYDRILAYGGPDMYFGGVNAVRFTPEGELEAAADPRRSGGAAFA